eukprot:Amastigsp_a681167_12.p4 type:complete len:131 gc:universal Amastigsp_a681167_12:477-869(+)
MFGSAVWISNTNCSFHLGCMLSSMTRVFWTCVPWTTMQNASYLGEPRLRASFTLTVSTLRCEPSVPATKLPAASPDSSAGPPAALETPPAALAPPASSSKSRSPLPSSAAPVAAPTPAPRSAFTALGERA